MLLAPRFKYYHAIFILTSFYIFLFYIIYFESGWPFATKNINDDITAILLNVKNQTGNLQRFNSFYNEAILFFNSTQYRTTIYISDIKSRVKLSLIDRLNLSKQPKKESVILLWDDYYYGLDQRNLRGCPDWRCRITSNRTMLKYARAVIFTSPPYNIWQEPNQYFIFYSQESPKNSIQFQDFKDSRFNTHFNFTLGFRFESPAVSPYGFTMRLADISRRSWEQVKTEIAPFIAAKSKTIAWFVSHCSTSSHREKIVEALKKEIKIDIFGNCGSLSCERGGICQNMLNTNYFFYFAAENSICTDYVTEKLWSHGFNRTIVPIVLKRSIVEKLAPPHSFIAVDDFTNAMKMSNYLKGLITNKTAYLEYFRWRTEYATIMLDELVDPIAEKPWGLCQICRLTQLRDRPLFQIANMTSYWDSSCEKDGNLAEQFLKNTIIPKRKSSLSRFHITIKKSPLKN